MSPSVVQLVGYNIADTMLTDKLTGQMWTESAMLHLRQNFDILNDQEKSTKISHTSLTVSGLRFEPGSPEYGRALSHAWPWRLLSLIKEEETNLRCQNSLGS